MSNPYYYTPENRPESSYILLAAVVFVVVTSTFVAFDYGLANNKANTIAEITLKEMSTPENPGESPYLLVLQKGDTSYQVRVPKIYYNQVEVGSFILIAERTGFFTGHVYRSWIFDGMIPLKTASYSKSYLSDEGCVCPSFHLAHIPTTSCRDLKGLAAINLKCAYL